MYNLQQPQTTAFNTSTPTTSFLAIILLLVGLSDILTLSMPEEIWLVQYWGPQAPLRATIFTIVGIFTFITTPSTRRSGAGRMSHPIPLGNGMGGAWDGLRNRVFLTFAFLEAMSWFWVWVTLREETGKFQARKRRRGSSGMERRGSF
jgi:hypothetical protein